MTRRNRNQESEREPFLARTLDSLLGTGTTRRVFTIALWMILGGSVVIALGLGIPELLERRTIATQGSIGRLEIIDAPEWFTSTPQLAAELEHATLEITGTDPNDRTNLVRAHTMLEMSGWFKEIERLHRQSDGTIVVHGTLVRPFAVVRWGNWDHLIDEEGNLLDWPYPVGSASPDLAVITGASTPPPTNEYGELSYGTCWAHAREVEAGLALARTIHESEWRTDISAIDVSRYMDTRCLWLETGSGPRIAWGIAPDDLSAAEVSGSDKVRMLDWIHSAHGSLNSLPRTEIDVRHDVSTTTAAVTR